MEERKYSYYDKHECPWYKDFGAKIIDFFLILWGVLIISDVLKLHDIFMYLWVIIYLLPSEILWQRTLGMFICRIRITMFDGSRPPKWRLLLRVLCLPLSIFAFVGFKWTINDGSQLIFIHDRISKTFITSPTDTSDNCY